MRDGVVANPVAAGVHVARDRERRQVEEDAVADEPAVLVRGDGVAAASAFDAPDHAVGVDVDDLVSQAVQPPADRMDDDVVRPDPPQGGALDDMIVRGLGNGRRRGEGKKRAYGSR
jgi:hypothetical protein